MHKLLEHKMSILEILKHFQGSQIITTSKMLTRGQVGGGGGGGGGGRGGKREIKGCGELAACVFSTSK